MNNFPKQEKKILRFWKENNVFQKSLKGQKKAASFVFYEGPPTANGKPGIHHVLTRVFKDIICRYKTMKGFKVVRKAGWDTHGLPVELQIEKKLGIKSKKEIEKYGIAKFNKKCKQSVWQYKNDWEKLTNRIGFWLDLENPYITYESEYIESLWWILKEVFNKGLLYQGFKVTQYCPRCGTPLSTHEVAQGYKKIKEPSVFVKLRIINPEFKNCYLLIWTTTPWTLPGNVAVAVNPEIVYAKVKFDNEYLIVAKERISVLGFQAEIIEEYQGKELLDLYYEAFYPQDFETTKTAYKVLPGDFVSLEEGTGLVHIAPAFGEDDMEAVKKENKRLKKEKIGEIPVLININEEGRFNLDVKKWAGMFFKDADPLIIADLKERGFLVKEEMYEHDYPFCWRCKTPLIYYAKKTWLIKMRDLKQELIKNNKLVNWFPSHIKEGRFGEWLREVKDWAVSRERYWGTPLPAWQCKACLNTEVIGSKKELFAQKQSNNHYFILRHGETINVADSKEIIYSKQDDLSMGLTKKGEEQIKRVAKRLKRYEIDLIFSSDFYRTKVTAGIVAKELGLKVKLDKKLRDVNLGIYKGKDKKELYKDFPRASIKDRFYIKPKGGETWLNCRKRVISFIDKIDKKHDGKTILIVSHGDPLWLLEGTLKGLSQDDFTKQKLAAKAIRPGELRKIDYSQIPLNEKGELDLHRPFIDKIKYICSKCGGVMERVPEVLDCWFDSGSMPFAQYHYPFENKKMIDKKLQFPAEFICEAVDQTRGWFYTLLAVSTLLGKGPSYKNVISLGHILDEKGEKMSKSKGNIVEPWYIADKYGIDAVRWYFYTANQPGEPKLFAEKDVEEKLKKFLMNFSNCLSFFLTYVSRDYLPKIARLKTQPKSNNVLDKWILSELNSLVFNVTKQLDGYDITLASRSIEDFVINNLSLWYIRRSRKRFQKPETEEELKKAASVLGFVLLTLSRISAPFIPFFAETIYQKIRGKGSVHLEKWPRANKKSVDRKLSKLMLEVRNIVALALAQRAKAGLKVRQPLAELKITDKSLIKRKDLLELIKEEINVLEINLGNSFYLDIKITDDLERKGILREIIRNIQQLRKEMSFTPKDVISIYFNGSDKIKEIVLENKDNIIKETKAKELIKADNINFKKTVEINKEKLQLLIKK